MFRDRTSSKIGLEASVLSATEISRAFGNCHPEIRQGHEVAHGPRFNSKISGVYAAFWWEFGVGSHPSTPKWVLQTATPLRPSV